MQAQLRAKIMLLCMLTTVCCSVYIEIRSNNVISIVVANAVDFFRIKAQDMSSS